MFNRSLIWRDNGREATEIHVAANLSTCHLPLQHDHELFAQPSFTTNDILLNGDVGGDQGVEFTNPDQNQIKRIDRGR